MKKQTQSEISELLTRGVEEIIVREHLEKSLHAGEKLRIKLGIDPTGPHLHIGHSVVLRKLKQFQQCGHHIILIIGDFTARIGDPSGKSETRKILSEQQVKENTKTYLQQIEKILDLTSVEIRYNGEWFYTMTPLALMQLAARFTVQRVLERDDFQKRLKADADISVMEVLYPVLQGYDSVMINADVELGGTDQKFNMLFGRRVQRRLEKPEQDVITMKLLTDPTGKKMGKTEGNMIMLEDAPEDMYGKVMAWGDRMIIGGFELCTDVPMDEVREIEAAIGGGGSNPRDAKARLAREIVALYHGGSAAKSGEAGSGPAGKAEATFVSTFQKHETPTEIPNIQLPISNIAIIDLLVKAKLATSKGEARRVVEQGGVKVDEKVVDDVNAVVKLSKKGVLVQKGKRHFVRVLGS